MMEAPLVKNATISSIAKPKSLILFVTNSRKVSAFCELTDLAQNFSGEEWAMIFLSRIADLINRLLAI